MRNIRIALWAVVVVLGGVIGWLTLEMTKSREQMVEAPYGVPFELTAQNGQTITEKNFSGKPTALFFGFTHCPEVCPTTLLRLGGLTRQLGADAARLKILLITVDPERDTPAQLALYLQSFDPRVVGLTGSREQVDAALKAYKAYAKRIPTDNGYTMDHSASVYLMRADGSFRTMIDYHEEEASALAKIRMVLG